MSAYVLNQEDIEQLTQATAAMLRLNHLYPASYYLAPDTVKLLREYTDDLHNLYRALYIANIKAVNGRYHEETRTLPKYRPLTPWNTDHLTLDTLKKAAGRFNYYLYQCSEDPIYGSAIFNAFTDIYKLLCMVIVEKSVNWHGENR